MLKIIFEFLEKEQNLRQGVVVLEIKSLSIMNGATEKNSALLIFHQFADVAKTNLNTIFYLKKLFLHFFIFQKKKNEIPCARDRQSSKSVRPRST